MKCKSYNNQVLIRKHFKRVIALKHHKATSLEYANRFIKTIIVHQLHTPSINSQTTQTPKKKTQYHIRTIFLNKKPHTTNNTDTHDPAIRPEYQNPCKYYQKHPSTTVSVIASSSRASDQWKPLLTRGWRTAEKTALCARIADDHYSKWVSASRFQRSSTGGGVSEAFGVFFLAHIRAEERLQTRSAL